MKKFIVNLFSNRFGIVLATLNVCYFASKGSGITNQLFGQIFVCAHFPAAISALLSLGIVKIFLHKLSYPTEMNIANTFFAFFIVAQWLFITWIAKTIAQKLRPKEL
ncbi:MAG: hypothetical protein ABJA66_13980 [Actinomycetota bacterium]